jgi:hypothetical protein
VVSPRARLAQTSVNLGVVGLLAVGFVVAKLIVRDEIAEDNMFEITIDPSIGIYIALAATIGCRPAGSFTPTGEPNTATMTQPTSVRLAGALQSGLEEGEWVAS